MLGICWIDWEMERSIGIKEQPRELSEARLALILLRRILFKAAEHFNNFHVYFNGTPLWDNGKGIRWAMILIND